MKALESVQLLPTHIPGFDVISMGGLPKRRVTLVSGMAGTGKSTFAVQFLVEGIRQAGEACVFVTLEVSPAELRRDMAGFGWDIAGWEAEGKWSFVDWSPYSDLEDHAMIGDYELGGLQARIEAAVAKVGAKRLALDATTALFARLQDYGKIRLELFRVVHAIKEMGVTAIMTGERSTEDGEVNGHGVEDFVADNVIILRNVHDGELRRRSLEIIKTRGAPHRRGEFPFVITSDKGIEVIPLSIIPMEDKASEDRATLGNEGLDQMTHGGLPRDSTLLVSGPAGTGKTLTATEFAAGGAKAGERCLFLGFEESKGQLFRNVAGWGYDFRRLEASGLLRVICEYPEATSLEDRLIVIRELMDEFRPDRLVIDSLSALGRQASEKGFREFAVGLNSLIKQAQIPSLFTYTLEDVVGATTTMDRHLPTLIDSIILLRYVEIGTQIHRGLTILKMRGSGHDTTFREITIDGCGLHVGPMFQGLPSILTGGQAVENDPKHAVRKAGN